MTTSKAPTHFSSSTSLHIVTTAARQIRDRPLISDDAAALLTVLDGLMLVYSARALVEEVAPKSRGTTAQNVTPSRPGTPDDRGLAPDQG